ALAERHVPPRKAPPPLVLKPGWLQACVKVSSITAKRNGWHIHTASSGLEPSGCSPCGLKWESGGGGGPAGAGAPGRPGRRGRAGAARGGGGGRPAPGGAAARRPEKQQRPGP